MVSSNFIFDYHQNSTFAEKVHEMQPVHLPMVDLPIDNPHLSDILKVLSCTSVLTIPRFPEGPAGGCYWNVDSMIKKHGGHLVLGWMIHWLPDLYVQATHHGVWKTPEGELVDITLDQFDAVKGDIKEGITTFAPDNSLDIDLNWPVMHLNKHHVILQDPDVINSLYFYRINCQAIASLYQYLKLKRGHSWTLFEGLKMGPIDEETRILLQNNNTLTDLSYELMHQNRKNIQRKFFSS